MNNHTLTSRVLAVALLASLAAGCGGAAVTTNSNNVAQTGAADSTPATATPAQNAAAVAATPAAHDMTTAPPAPPPAGAQSGGAAADPAATANPVKTPDRPATARAANVPKPQIGSGGNDFYVFTQAQGALAAAEELKSSSIIIEVSGGVATLSGTVTTDSQKQKAERLVKSVRGVTGVKNQIRVAAGAPK